MLARVSRIEVCQNYREEGKKRSEEIENGYSGAKAKEAYIYIYVCG
jgi:hypothetical protein